VLLRGGDDVDLVKFCCRCRRCGGALAFCPTPGTQSRRGECAPANARHRRGPLNSDPALRPSSGRPAARRRPSMGAGQELRATGRALVADRHLIDGRLHILFKCGWRVACASSSVCRSGCSDCYCRQAQIARPCCIVGLLKPTSIAFTVVSAALDRRRHRRPTRSV